MGVCVRVVEGLQVQRLSPFEINLRATEMDSPFAVFSSFGLSKP